MDFLRFLALSLLGSIAILLHNCIALDAVSPQLNDDILGLIVFKSALHDPSSLLASWNEDDDSPCSWEFVKCNPINGRVSELSIDGFGLSGRIGRGFEKLQHLKVLSLSGNNFTGNLSPELVLPPSLQRVTFSRNRLSGRIPTSLISMSSIRFLDFSDNLFSGPIPDEMFANCSSLHYLSLASNMLQGPVPNTLHTRCLYLNTLNLSANQFSGSLDLWSLTRLRTLDLSKNAFSGYLPQGISAIHSLKELKLQSNQFSGPLPTDLGLCLHLSTLDVSRNRLTGPLPESMRLLTSLTFLNIGFNTFSGELPQWIGNMTSLNYVEFSSNGFTGSLPLAMGGLRSVKYMSFSNNKLSGNIPETLMKCSELSVLKLEGNSLNGRVPEGLFELGLEEINLSQNELIGSVPVGSSKLYEKLTRMDLSRNRLEGNFPAEMGLYKNLKYLNLSWNNFKAKIPPEMGLFQNLNVLDLRSSDLHGSIPGELCDSGSLGILQLDGNSLIGPIPDEIGNCVSLYLLSLSHNNLSGEIPKSISKLSKLEILRLESNELSGEIPQELGILQNLLAVNISYNMLTGRLPVGGIFPSLDQSALQGNLGLCSPLLKGPCKMNVPKPLVLDPNAYPSQMGGQTSRDKPSQYSNSSPHHVFFSVSAIVAISAATFIALGVLVVTLLNVSARRRSLAFVDNALESMCSSSSKSGTATAGKLVLFDSNSRGSPNWVSNHEALLNKASEIGAGVFGTVYKVSLGDQGGRDVAIKKLVKSNMIQNVEDFDREIQILGKVKHPNLISLKGYYWTAQTQLLVMEYATNGSLQTQLHGRLPSSPPLSWDNRFKIVLGTAKGLAHLHHSFRPPIVHYDLKPTNILLDENFNPKISDYGLARLLTKLDKHIVNNRFQSALGYIAPELACQSIRVNEKCDVHGFGVMVLEIVTGRRPVEYGEDNVVILTDHVRYLLERGNVLDCVDPSMSEYSEDEVVPILKLALVCISQIPSSRPSMAEVVQILQVIKAPLPQTIPQGF
ncbi:probably inactive leucine-rich repeat receptor-like protein kinase At3g28040 [Cucurbita maxima]|uniref:Probably inactive leucine-rich repeat receptor-like protein kinase At3g28040 n=1 Tax=Cucurbita maxima TaxID=3661 RepID=A0A6J1IRG5_CUCMA|nr:probably inactive leucine-rich repeat receptor-like protein kinase At3g28040 [Cucurbita maxima]